MAVRVTLRGFAGALGAALVALGCATRSQPTVDAAPRTHEECLDEARRASGYRGVPKRTNSQIEQRMAERWPDFVRAYEECMRAHGHEDGREGAERVGWPQTLRLFALSR